MGKPIPEDTLSHGEAAIRSAFRRSLLTAAILLLIGGGLYLWKNDEGSRSSGDYWWINAGFSIET